MNKIDFEIVAAECRAIRQMALSAKDLLAGQDLVVQRMLSHISKALGELTDFVEKSAATTDATQEPEDPYEYEEYDPSYKFESEEAEDPDW